MRPFLFSVAACWLASAGVACGGETGDSTLNETPAGGGASGAPSEGADVADRGGGGGADVSGGAGGGAGMDPGPGVDAQPEDPQSPEPADLEPVTHWTGDEEYRDVQDSSGDPLVVGAVGFVPGLRGAAFEFDGWSYISLGDDPRFEITESSSMSVAAWFNSTTSNNGYLVAKADIFSPDFGWLVDINPPEPGGRGALRYLIANYDEMVVIQPAMRVNDGRWHHFVATHEGATGAMSLYLDGVAVGSAVESFGAIDDGGVELRIGTDSSDAGHGFVGLLDDVRIYDYALSATQVGELYRAR